MTQFDASRALREEIQGLTEIRTQLIAMERRAREELDVAETKHSVAIKIRGFCDAELTRKRQRLVELEERNK